MFKKLFGNSEPALKDMLPGHVRRVVEIIAETDEDDANEAEETLLERGTDGMFVLMQEGRILGLTGYARDENVDDIAWLSWTYLTHANQGEGLGEKMLNDMLGRLNRIGIRKIFMDTSDYAEEGVPIYANAHKMYESFGAEKELIVPGYHSMDEAKITYGLDNPEYPQMPENLKDLEKSAAGGLSFTGLIDAPETDDVVGLIWDEVPKGEGVSGLSEVMKDARQAGTPARMVVLTLPGDLSSANEEHLQSCGLNICGRLENYYAFGIEQVWWACSFE